MKSKIKKEMDTFIKESWNENILKKQSNHVNYFFEKIHFSNFNTIIVKYLNDSLVKTITITFSESVYHVYENENYHKFDLTEIQSKLNEFSENRILSIQLQGIISEFNLYGYPEVFTIKVY